MEPDDSVEELPLHSVLRPAEYWNEKEGPLCNPVSRHATDRRSQRIAFVFCFAGDLRGWSPAAPQIESLSTKSGFS